MKCKRRLSITRNVIPATGALTVNVGAAVAELLLRVVDGAGTPLAFTVAVEGAETAAWQLQAGEAWSEERMEHTDPFGLVVAAAGGSIVQVARWEG